MLQRALAGIQGFADPNVVVGYGKADDGGVYRLDEHTALVQTVDFFTPVVDDPFVYGQIAAANALSDVYAMGGVPRFALSIVGFPKEKLEEAILHEVLQGGAAKMKQARVAVIGGHSVQDPELKFGYCVSGVVDPQRIYTNSGARPGDALLLTKPLGTGIVTTGIKFGKTSPRVAREATEWMLQLNALVRDQLQNYSVHAVTDITGYGLAGHAFEMARGSEVTLELTMQRIPVMEGVEQLARQGMLSRGIESNRGYLGETISWNGISSLQQQILLDPQTSGGLLISLPSEEATRLVDELETKGHLCRLIGKVIERQSVYIRVQ